MPRKAQAQARNDHVDALRGLAILGVVIYHAWPGLAPAGYLAVDLFFVISGYFVVRALTRPGAAAHIYLAGRFTRLLPALVPVIAACLAVGWAIFLPGELSRLAAESLAGLFFVSNAVTPAAGYFGPGADGMPLLHLWSLSVEMQVYAIAAALLLPALRIAGPVPVLSAIVAASLAWWWLGSADPFHDPAARAWQFALGGLAGRLALPRRAGLLACLGLVAVFVAGPDGYSQGATLLATLLGTAALSDALSRPEAGLPLLPALGRVSYPLYLWHWPAIVLWDAWSPAPVTSAETAALLGGALCLSVLSYRAVEAPASAFPRMALPVSIAGLLLCAAVAAGLVLGGGAPSRLPAEARAVLDAIRPAHDRASACHASPWHPVPVETACRHNDDRAVTTAILGDSHAMTIAGGLARAGLPLAEYTFSGCGPARGLYPETHGPDCAEWLEAALDRIQGDPAIERVIVAARWPFYLEDRFDNGRGGRDIHDRVVMRRARDGAVAGRREILAAFAESIDTLVSSGRHVVLYAPGPSFGWDVEREMARAAWFGRDLDLSVPRRMLARRQGAARAMLLARGVELYDPMPLFCDTVACRPAPRGTALVEDQNHLSRAGADAVAAGIIPLLDTRSEAISR